MLHVTDVTAAPAGAPRARVTVVGNGCVVGNGYGHVLPAGAPPVPSRDEPSQSPAPSPPPSAVAPPRESLRVPAPVPTRAVSNGTSGAMEQLVTDVSHGYVSTVMGRGSGSRRVCFNKSGDECEL